MRSLFSRGFEPPELNDPKKREELRRERQCDIALLESYKKRLSELLTKERKKEFDENKYKELRFPINKNKHFRRGPIGTHDNWEMDYFLNKPQSPSYGAPLKVSPYPGDRTTALGRSFPEIDQIIKELTKTINDDDQVLIAPSEMWGSSPAHYYPCEQVKFFVTEPEITNHRYYLLDQGINPYLFGILSSLIVEKINKGEIVLRNDELKNFNEAESSLRSAIEELIKHIDPSFTPGFKITIRLSDIVYDSLKVINLPPEYVVPHLKRYINQDKNRNDGLAGVKLIEEEEFKTYLET